MNKKNELIKEVLREALSDESNLMYLLGVAREILLSEEERESVNEIRILHALDTARNILQIDGNRQRRIVLGMSKEVIKIENKNKV